MSENIFFYVFLGILILIIISIILLYYFNTFTPPKIQQSSTDLDLKIPAPWSHPNPVQQNAGKCLVYTFATTDKYVPVTAKFSLLNSCITNGTCFSSPQQDCIDPDQLMAQKMVHVCTGNELTNLTSSYCLKQDGKKAKLGEVEEYYQKCGTNEEKQIIYCKGSLSLLTFNLDQGKSGPNVFDNAHCMSVPLYNIDSKGNYQNIIGVKSSVCNSAELYDNFPAQLFRIERASFDGKNFIINSSGQFAKIIHRKSGYVLAPTSDYRLQFIKSGQNYQKSGYWWVLLDSLRYDNYYSPPQIIYFPDPTIMPTQSGFLTFLTSNNIYSLQVYGDEIVLKKFFYSTNTVGINEYATQYIDYPLLPLIIQSPQNFVF